MTRTRTRAPSDLVDPSGNYRFGTFDGPVARPALLDASSRIPRFLRNLRLKEWEAFQLGNEEWFVLGAVYSAKVMALLQVLVVERATDRITRYEARLPPGRVRVATGLGATTSTGTAGGFSLTINNAVTGRPDAARTAAGGPSGDSRPTGDRPAGIGSEEDSISIRAVHPGDRSLPPMSLEVTGRCGPDEAGHLVICHPFSDRRALYSHKSMMGVRGGLRLGAGPDAREIAFGDATSFLILDDHKGEYPSPMEYDWVTGARRTPGGPVVGFNLTDNQIRDPARFNENALFVGPEVHLLPPVTIDRPDGVERKWHITSTPDAESEARVDLVFTPRVPNLLRIGPRGWLADYHGPFGSFEGKIVTADGPTVDVGGFYGMGERKRIRL